MQNQCNLNVRSKCILNALKIRKGCYDIPRACLLDRSPVSAMDLKKQ